MAEQFFGTVRQVVSVTLTDIGPSVMIAQERRLCFAESHPMWKIDPFIVQVKYYGNYDHAREVTEMPNLLDGV